MQVMPLEQTKTSALILNGLVLLCRIPVCRVLCRLQGQPLRVSAPPDLQNRSPPREEGPFPGRAHRSGLQGDRQFGHFGGGRAPLPDGSPYGEANRSPARRDRITARWTLLGGRYGQGRPGGPERGFPGKNPGGLSDAVHSEIRRSLARVAP